MNNELIEHKCWWKRNWKWFVPLSGILLIIISLVISSGITGIGVDFAQAYSDTKLYEDALQKAKSNPNVIEVLGEIEPIDKLAILEGEVQYSNNNNTLNSSIRITGSKGKARLDISADKIDSRWSYKIINVRVKNPLDKRQTIEIIKIE